MLRHCFIVMIALLVALQSTASVINETVASHDTDHHPAHAYSDEARSDAPTAPPPPADDHKHAADHCHHSHNCFHQALTGSLLGAWQSSAGLPCAEYREAPRCGVLSSPFRPPIS
ncbi:hypothetical protein [Haliea atlantica]